jgi:hypothetical protein
MSILEEFVELGALMLLPYGVGGFFRLFLRGTFPIPLLFGLGFVLLFGFGFGFLGFVFSRILAAFPDIACINLFL